IQLYGFDGAVWLPVLDATMDSDVLFADVANIGGRDRLISYEQGRVNWFDPESASERPLVEVAMHYNAADNLEGSATQPGGDIPHVDITRDLNHDGRDDLILPDFDGFWISTQLSDGSFTGAVKLGPPEPFLDARWEARSYKDFGLSAGTIPVYLSRVHEMDYNRDGRSDLVFWNEDHFDVYAQNERGLFDPVATTFTADVPIDSDGAYSRISDFGDEGLLSLMFGFNENTRRTVLHSLRDLDGDQVADLVTLTLAGRAAFKQRSLYEAHFGTTTPDGTLFARDVSTAIHPRGKAGLGQPSGYSSQWFEDFDGDGQVDIMFRDVRIGLGGMARALVGNSVAIDLELYRMEDGVYPDKPTFKRNIRRFAPFAGIGNVFLPTVRIGDVNGDERVDLLVGQSPEKLHIFLGVPGPKLLTRKPQNVAVALPSDERHTRLVDLNKDGKEDVLVHQTPTSHEPTNPHRITVLIAR
ncbi:MAG: VCBS repeat-containing protein, partial [Gammaproteobacteria bacterium]|nr:VCBS repeat-containing protein [Gammaproteobacteria bacterium]